MVGNTRDNSGYEQLRHADVPIVTPAPLRKSKSRSQDAMQAPLDRPTLGTPSTNRVSNTPTPGNRTTLYASSFEDREAMTRASLEARTPLGKKPVPARRTNSMNTTNTAITQQTQMTPNVGADDSDGDREPGASYFDPQAGPAPNQFLSARPRPMSFYDMKEQSKQAKHPGLGGNRSSWRSGEMPYNYNDIIGDNRFSYTAPTMGRQQERKGKDKDEFSPMRLPWTMWMHSEAKNLFVAALGEWVGTTMFLFFAFAGTQVANAESKTPAESTTTNATTGFNPVVMLYISVSFGFSLMVNVWVFFRISGGLFNPAVTLALWATRAIGVKRAIVLFLSQIVGSITASALVLAIFPTPLNVRTTLSDGTSLAQGLFIEAFMTAELVFTILMLAKEKHRSTFIAPIGIGLALFVAELVGVYYTGGSLNPARSLGPCIVTGSFDSEHWIYWVGPGIGCLFAIAFYKFIKTLEYEMANPGQDGDESNDPTKNPNHALREKQREMTTRILNSLGYENPAVPNPAEAQRAAEEGTYFTSRTSSVMDDSDHERRPYGVASNPQLALSTVASMNETIGSPPRTSHVTPPARTSIQGDRARLGGILDGAHRLDRRTIVTTPITCLMLAKVDIGGRMKACGSRPKAVPSQSTGVSEALRRKRSTLRIPHKGIVLVPHSAQAKQ
ncbi:mip family channel protein [Seiridium cupressi]